MAILLRPRSRFLSHLESLINNVQRYNHTLSEEGLCAENHSGSEMDSDPVTQPREYGFVVDKSKWKKVNAKLFGITPSMIPSAPLTVMSSLRSLGFEAYLVGGCVRDLLLHRVPKDYDVITTAQLKQIRKKFYRSMIVGRRFPICMVEMKGSVVEVSSFETVAEHAEEEEKILLPQVLDGCGKKDYILWRNSMQRDFTINSLFFDPFKNQIYDYADAMADLRSSKLRTVIPAQLSFQEDSARILRGLRIAGRLGLSISKDTETAIHKLSSSLKTLAKARVMLELNYMLSYGAAESTIWLLQRFNLLKIFLPFQAAYLEEQGHAKACPRSTMLMKLFANLDRLVSCDRPCNCNCWVGLLAFHQALVLNPQDALVIWVFASVLYHGEWNKGVEFARENAILQDEFAPEISGFFNSKSDEELAGDVTALASLVQNSIVALVDADNLYKSMSRYPVYQCSGLVFVSKCLGKKVAQLFNVLVDDIVSYSMRRERFQVNYKLLATGNLCETRYALGKVILETLSCELVGGGTEVVEEEPKVIKEKGDSRLHDVIKDNLSPKGMIKGKKSVKTIFCSEEDKTKKVDTYEIAKKHQETVKTSQIPNEELITTQKNKSGEKNQHWQQTVKDNTAKLSKEKNHVVVENENDQGQARKRRKSVGKVKNHELYDKETEQKLSKSRKITFVKDEKNKNVEKKESEQLLQEVLQDKSEKLVMEKSGRLLLSHLFRR